MPLCSLYGFCTEQKLPSALYSVPASMWMDMALIWLPKLSKRNEDKPEAFVDLHFGSYTRSRSVASSVLQSKGTDW
ncbi:hypothetical protein KQX54_001800 [Cotesia glomerata]|uniref:Uncharacterized protein n=1 Tax=Cotesia glomerata TaxID=32391 RepID=A0AAV7IAH6_COTGL|nr:hypothetical protein KQX54_001800 [Cotesia glomerata]